MLFEAIDRAFSGFHVLDDDDYDDFDYTQNAAPADEYYEEEEATPAGPARYDLYDDEEAPEEEYDIWDEPAWKKWQ